MGPDVLPTLIVVAVKLLRVHALRCYLRYQHCNKFAENKLLGIVSGLHDEFSLKHKGQRAFAQEVGLEIRVRCGLKHRRLGPVR